MQTRLTLSLFRVAALALTLLAVSATTQAQSASVITGSAAPADSLLQDGQSKDTTAEQPTDDKSPAISDNYIFPHSQTSPFWVSGQANFIFQYHPPFRSPYSGANSLPAQGEHAMSRVYTLFTGVQLTPYTELLFDVESAGGKGIGNALGLAGYANLDVVRNPTLGTAPYVARVMVHQIIPLSSTMVDNDRGPLSLATQLPERRIELRAGRFSMADFFDVNTLGSDSHRQFMNWTVDNNGAFDYAADTRGYTYGFIVEYQEPRWGVRFGEALMPTIANGLDLDWKLSRAHSENLEFEFRHQLIAGQTGTVRLLAYRNTANMGDYRQAIDAFQNGSTPVPDVVATRLQGRTKYGVGLNFEQPLNEHFGIFGRLGWSDGLHESFAYTEVDNTVSLGGIVKGDLWGRAKDKLGFALVSNGISQRHRQYLALGGQGFLLGDGNLRYGRENIFETFYTAQLARGVTIGPDLQLIANPGYNRDRGPVVVAGFRLHLEF